VDDAESSLVDLVVKSFQSVFDAVGWVESVVYSQLLFQGDSPISLERGYPDEKPAGLNHSRSLPKKVWSCLEMLQHVGHHDGVEVGLKSSVQDVAKDVGNPRVGVPGASNFNVLFIEIDANHPSP